MTLWPRLPFENFIVLRHEIDDVFERVGLLEVLLPSAERDRLLEGSLDVSVITII